MKSFHLYKIEVQNYFEGHKQTSPQKGDFSILKLWIFVTQFRHVFKAIKTYSYQIIILMYLLNISTVYGQKTVYKHYTTEDGLPHDITYQIIQDSEEYIWLGTDDGLVKFNGKEFIVFGSEKGLKSNYVIDVEEDTINNQKIIGTWGRGLHILKNDSIYKNDLPSKDYSKIHKVYKLNDSLIYGATGTSKQLFYDLKNNKKIALSIEFKGDFLQLVDQINMQKVVLDINQNFIEDTLYIYDSELNVATKDDVKGIYTLDGFDLKKENLKEIDNIPIHALTKQQDYLVAASFNTVFFYDQKKFLEKRKLNLPPGKIIQIKLFKKSLYFVFINKDDGLREFYKYDIQNDFLTNISKKITIKSSVSDFMFDNKSNLWITTYGDGVYQLPNTRNAFFDKGYFSKSDLRDVASFELGVFTIAPNVIYFIDSFDTVSLNKIPFHTEVFQVRNNVQLQLIIPNLEKSAFTLFFKGIKVNNRSSKEYDFIEKGKKYKLIYNRVEIENEQGTLTKKLVHFDVGTFIQSAAKYKEQIFGVYGRLGIYSINTKENKISHWNKKMGIEANMFTDIAIQNNVIWVGTNSGVYKVSNDSVTCYTVSNGLASNHINDLFVDEHGVLWIATQKGLNVFKNDVFYTIDKNLGQKSSSVKKITEHSNYLYVAGNRGLFKYDNLKPFAPSLHTNLRVSQTNEVFNVVPVNFTNPNTVKIQYKLNENDWVNVLNQKLSFKNISQGNHALVFRFKDGLSNWNYTKPYNFGIINPWYEQLWFYILLIFSVAGSTLLIVYNQLVKARKKNEIFQKTIHEREKLQEDLRNVRHQIAQDFHDDLGNKLASISMLSSLSLKKTLQESNLYPSLLQINKDANSLYAGMRDFVWSLDYKNNQLREVQIYLNDFGEKLFEYSDINFKSSNNVAKLDVTLPHYWNKQLVLVFKEAMTNTLKHSKATEVLFSLYLHDDILEIKLEDNGIGFDINATERKNGLRNMKERALSINGELNLETSNGFRVYFKGKINE